MEKNILVLAVLLIGITAIIGVMNNMDDGTGNKTSRLKLIRSESIGDYS